jgi:uncharacterized protein (TIGR02118 family)
VCRRAAEGGAVIKRVSMVRRREDLSHDEFVAYWLGPHADIAREMPGALAYVVNIARDPEAAGWDGFAEVWFESIEAAEAAFASEPFASRIRADRPKFVGEQNIFFVEEIAVIEPATDG